jgi:hypothetical protein
LRKKATESSQITSQELLGAIGVEPNVMDDRKDWVFKVMELKGTGKEGKKASQSSVLVKYFGYRRGQSAFVEEVCAKLLLAGMASRSCMCCVVGTCCGVCCVIR